METLIRTEELTKRFPRVVANDAISLDVRYGEIHCLLGENGAGKSTFSECLYGAYQPTAGRIFFMGQQVQISSPADAIALGIGMVHQHFVLVPPLTVIENIIAGTSSLSQLVDYRRAEEEILQLCDQYGVELDLYDYLKNLLMEEKVLVGVELRRALIFIPAFLLAMNSSIYAEDRQSSFLDLEFKQQTLYGIDGNNSLPEEEKIYRRNQRYLNDALMSYSKMTLRSIGLSNQTVNLIGATLSLATKGAKMDLNENKTLAIHIKDVGTNDRALYFGYSLDW